MSTEKVNIFVYLDFIVYVVPSNGFQLYDECNYICYAYSF